MHADADSLARVVERISDALGVRLDGGCARAVGGGLSRAIRCASAVGPVLIKLNGREKLEMFEAEALGLQALATAAALGVPRVVAVGRAGEHAFLVIEWIEFGRASPAAETRLGRGLAAQHRCTSARFGWRRNNTIGLTPQDNTWTAAWLEFWRDRRLGPQLERAAANGLPQACRDQGARLLEGLDALLLDHEPEPSLLHGDLWSGNWGATPAGKPYVFDPAVYYGDREADLAMTRLFGGFGPAFYRAYGDAFRLPHGWEVRSRLYALYHLLNHFNLFGAAYLGQVTRSLAALGWDLQRAQRPSSSR